MTPLEAAKAELARRQGVEAAKAELARRQGAQNAGGVEGGRIVSENGRDVFRSPGFATADPEQVEFLRSGGTVSQLTQSTTDQATIGNNPLSSRVAKVIQGVPLLGQYTDEAAGAVLGENSRQGIRDVRNAMDREKPGQSAALEIGGGVLGSIPAVAAVAAPVAAVPSAAGKIAAGTTIGTAAGAVDGAISGYGAGETPEGRLQSATQGAVFGAAVGGATGGLLPGLGSLSKAGMRKMRGLDVDEISTALGVSKKAAGIIKGYLRNEDLDLAETRLRQLGDDAMLADAGPATGQALDTAASSGGAALVTARQAADGRAADLLPRLAGAMDRSLGDADGIKAASKAIAKKSSKVREAAFNRAFSQPIDYASEAGAKIQDVLDKIPDGIMQTALREANEAMIDGGRRNQQIMASIADDGSITFTQPLNVEQLHNLKMALSEIAESERKEITGEISARGLRAKNRAEDLRNILADAVKPYESAMKLGGDKISEQNALRMGYDIFKPSTTFENVKDIMRGASEDAKAAARKGMRQRIDETLDGVKRSISSPDADTQQTLRLLREMSSAGMRKKLQVILGPNDAKYLLSEMDRATTALELRAAIAGNSKTAIRQAGQQALDEAVDRSAVGSLLEANPSRAAQKAASSLTGVGPKQTAERRAALAAEIAQALTGKRGSEARQALALVKRAANGQALKDEQIERIVRQLEGPIAATVYQLGTHTLEQTQ